MRADQIVIAIGGRNTLDVRFLHLLAVLFFRQEGNDRTWDDRVVINRKEAGILSCVCFIASEQAGFS